MYRVISVLVGIVMLSMSWVLSGWCCAGVMWKCVIRCDDCGGMEGSVMFITVCDMYMACGRL